MGSNLPLIIKLYDYQKAWARDPSRFKIGMWSRQAGKSFAAALEAALDCAAKNTTWVFLSAGERQSKELVGTAQLHARAIGAASEFIDDEFRADDITYQTHEIRFANGSRIIGLPANPNTARGHSANILLDEFAFHRDSRAIWRAMFPTVTRGYKIRVISTPQGRQNKFYELWSGNDQYSKHKVSIHDAVSQGLILRDEAGQPCGPQELRLALGDDQAWAQEYLCEFLDEATAFLTYELIGEAEAPEALVNAPPQGGDIYMGVDVGRKRDLTVIWAVEDCGDVLITRRRVEIQGRPFSEQKEILYGLIKELNPRRVCMDATGLGMQLAEEARTSFGPRVEPVTFTLKVKEDLAQTLRRRFEDHQIRIPVDRKVREDLHSVKRIVTSSGNIRFDAERSEDGHADRFWALALAAHAASNPPGQVEYQSITERRFGRVAGAW
jgi:phage FluMu gp28-like protein